MSDNEKTRFFKSNSDEKTRLVRLSKNDEPKNLDKKIGSPKVNTQNSILEIPKTRLAGRSQSNLNENKFEEHSLGEFRPIAGWLVVIKGPGQGKYAPIFDGMNSVGRGNEQSTNVDFGDETISRDKHAFITYDLKTRNFYLSHGGKSNIIRCNGTPVLQVIELKNGDIISIGNTDFCFASFCGSNFDWADVK